MPWIRRLIRAFVVLHMQKADILMPRRQFISINLATFLLNKIKTSSPEKEQKNLKANLSSGFWTRSYTKEAVCPQKMARSLKFRILEAEGASVPPGPVIPRVENPDLKSMPIIDSFSCIIPPFTINLSVFLQFIFSNRITTSFFGYHECLAFVQTNTTRYKVVLFL